MQEYLTSSVITATAKLLMFVHPLFLKQLSRHIKGHFGGIISQHSRAITDTALTIRIWDLPITSPTEAAFCFVYIYTCEKDGNLNVPTTFSVKYANKIKCNHCAISEQVDCIKTNKYIYIKFKGRLKLLL